MSLLKFHFPVTAIASIAHRVTGVLLVLALLPALYLLDISLESEEGFARAAALVSHPLLALLWAGVLASYIYHLAAGVRHLFMDMGIGENLQVGRVSAFLVLALGGLSFPLMLAVLLL